MICMTHLQNTKNVLKNVGFCPASERPFNQNFIRSHWLFEQWFKPIKYGQWQLSHTFLMHKNKLFFFHSDLSCFIKKYLHLCFKDEWISLWNDMRVSNRCQSFHFYINSPFKGGGNAQASECNFSERTSEKSLFFSQLFFLVYDCLFSEYLNSV